MLGSKKCPDSGRRLETVPGATHYIARCPTCDRGFLLPYISLPRHYAVPQPATDPKVLVP